jgi:competence ComEA-like helix-hairpin-helix protein
VLFEEVAMAEQRINLNTATVEELTQLPGIGPVLAERIVTYRDTVQPYEEPAGITAVSGVGERNYEAIADRVTVASPAESSPSTPEVAQDQAEDEEAPSEGSTAEEEREAEVEPEAEAEVAVEEEAEAEPAAGLAAALQAIPPGESFAEKEPPLEEGAEGAPGPGEEEAEKPEMETEAEEEAVPEAGEEPEEVLVEGEPPEEELPPAPLVSPAEATPSPPWWRRLSWLWSAILGGLLGMIFALIVFAGINGSLDIGHSRAVLGLKSDVSGLTTEVEALGTDVEGLRKRLEALEGLTARMDKVESAVVDLRDETSELRERTGALEEELGALSEQLQTVADDVETLQQQAERTESFFSGLRMLLDDVFGEVEGMSEPTPTPAPEGE